MDDAQLAKIAARADAATPGPWKAVHGEGSDNGWVFAPNYTVCDMWTTNATADFIAAARTDVPLLLDEIAGLKNTMSLYDGMVTREDDENRIIALEAEVTRLRAIVAAVEACARWMDSQTDTTMQYCAKRVLGEVSRALGGTA